jgi:transcriptional regulator with XRE-family HTH domain
MFCAMHQDQRRLLGDFVRAHRERLRPHGAAGRRRTPGLRREEVAQLSGISTTWYAWLEQGRDISLSPHALGRLAAALRLSRAERAYLFELAGRKDPAAPALAATADAPASIATAVERLAEPAYGLDPLWNACCWNAAAEHLFEPWLAGPERNLLRWIFQDEAARRLIDGFEDRARRVLAEFRADFSRSLNDPRMRALVEGLRQASSLFAALWDEQAVLEREGGLRRFHHPEDGTLEFDQFTYSPAERPDCKLVLLARR